MTRLPWKLALLAFTIFPLLAAADEAHEGHARTPDAILKDLKMGNARFVAGKAMRPHATPKRVKQLASGQHPEAAILGCADSRVPPEIVFDEGIGDLFVVRVAGNVSETYTVGSLEYAAEHLGVPLVVVLGHEKCGAVKSACEASAPVEGNIGTLLKEIQPAVDEAKQHPTKAGCVHDAVHVNAHKQAEELTASSPVLKKLVEEGKLKIVSAIYDLETGKVAWDE
jgi:carbonic anhydrase